MAGTNAPLAASDGAVGVYNYRVRSGRASTRAENIQTIGDTGDDGPVPCSMHIGETDGAIAGDLNAIARNSDDAEIRRCRNGGVINIQNRLGGDFGSRA